MNEIFLRQILHYCPDTGIFTWLVDRPPRGKRGEEAGYNNGSGYIKISIKGKRHYAHRLAFVYMGEPAPDIVDHLNGVRHDNRWANLRAVTQRENTANQDAARGVRYRYGAWYARFGNSHIGVFATEQEARAAYIAARDNQACINVSATHKHEPTKNMRRWSHRVELFEGKTLSQWARETGIPQPTLHYRIHKIGLSLSDAIRYIRDMTT